MKIAIYYDEDPDGWMSAAILIHKYPDAKLIAISKQGSHEINLIKDYDEVFVVDHSLWNEKNLQSLTQSNKTVHWIDHHKSAIENYNTHYMGVRDPTKASCLLTWNYIYKDKKIPPAVEHIADYDMWYFNLDNTKVFLSYLGTIPLDKILQKYEQLLDKVDLSQEYELGQTIQRYNNNLIDDMYNNGVKTTFLGYNAMIFSGHILRSELGHTALNRNKDIDIAVCMTLAKIDTDNKPVFKYSLRARTNGNVDAGKIAKQFGGGGHKGAAAFATKEVLL